MQNAALIAGAVSAVALVVSLLFLARQTRASALQALLANQIAGSEVKSDIFQTVDRILYQLVDHPHLRPYFYDGLEAPGADGATGDALVRNQVLSMAELFADAIERGLDSYRTVEPAADFRTPMDDYTRDLLAASPALRGLVSDRPRWWPNLAEWINVHDATLS
ncbi:MAG: hypothetical protein ACRDV0_09140 [Acidimicrobiales bacterium]